MTLHFLSEMIGKSQNCKIDNFQRKHLSLNWQLTIFKLQRKHLSLNSFKKLSLHQIGSMMLLYLPSVLSSPGLLPLLSLTNKIDRYHNHWPIKLTVIIKLTNKIDRYHNNWLIKLTVIHLSSPVSKVAWTFTPARKLETWLTLLVGKASPHAIWIYLQQILSDTHKRIYIIHHTLWR